MATIKSDFKRRTPIQALRALVRAANKSGRFQKVEMPEAPIMPYPLSMYAAEEGCQLMWILASHDDETNYYTIKTSVAGLLQHWYGYNVDPEICKNSTACLTLIHVAGLRLKNQQRLSKNCVFGYEEGGYYYYAKGNNPTELIEQFFAMRDEILIAHKLIRHAIVEEKTND